MRYGQFGSTGRQFPIVGQGSWEIDNDRREPAVAALRRDLDEGMTQIDTAENVRRCRIAGRGGDRRRRDELFLVSKLLPATPPRKG